MVDGGSDGGGVVRGLPALYPPPRPRVPLHPRAPTPPPYLRSAPPLPPPCAPAAAPTPAAGGFWEGSDMARAIRRGAGAGRNAWS